VGSLETDKGFGSYYMTGGGKEHFCGMRDVETLVSFSFSKLEFEYNLHLFTILTL